MEQALIPSKKVSVVMCTYNGARYLRQQLDSIINQTYPVFELIIQDDASIDNTVSIIKEYEKSYSFIRLYINQKTEGVNRNFFSVLKKAQGEYIAISDQDDIWERNKIERQMALIGNNLLCFHLSRPFSSDGVPVRFDTRRLNYSLIRMIFYNMVPGHTILMKKELLQQLKSYDLFFYDALLAIAAAISNKIIFVDEVLTNHRRYVTAFSYHEPLPSVTNLVSLWRYMNIICSDFFKARRNMEKHFNAMLKLLSLYASEPGKTVLYEDSCRLCRLFQKPIIISYIPSAFLCVKHREHVFYTKERGWLYSLVKALIHPIFIYQYYR